MASLDADPGVKEQIRHGDAVEPTGPDCAAADAVYGVDYRLSLLRRSLLFAEFSRVAYYDRETVAALGRSPLGSISMWSSSIGTGRRRIVWTARPTS